VSARRLAATPAVGQRRRFGSVIWVRTTSGWRTQDGRWTAERWEGSYNDTDTWRVFGPGFPAEGEMFGALRRAAPRIAKHLEAIAVLDAAQSSKGSAS